MRGLGVVSLLALAAVCRGEDAVVSDGAGTYVKVLGQSGKITVGQDENPSKDPKGLTIEMSAIREIDANGTAVGTEGSVKHSFESFASQDFSFSDVFDATLGSAKASAIAFTSTLVEQANLTVTVYMIKESGSYKVSEQEELSLTAGSMKFNVEVTDWPFCKADGTGATSCRKENKAQVGEGLELEIVMKSNDSKNKVEGEGKAYSVGSETSVTLSGQVKLDESWVSIVAGYPAFEMKGNKETFTFRFGKFQSSLLYDPVVSFNQPSAAMTQFVPSLFVALVFAFALFV